ncbi:MAG TPA: hypothetical protein VGN26_19885 [Armatimonadota bacterium]
MSFTYKPYRDACYEKACQYRAVARSLMALGAVILWFRYLLGGRRANALLEAICITLAFGLLLLDQRIAQREHRQVEEDPDRLASRRRRKREQDGE